MPEDQDMKRRTLDDDTGADDSSGGSEDEGAAAGSEVTLCPTAFEGVIATLRFTWWSASELKPTVFNVNPKHDFMQRRRLDSLQGNSGDNKPRISDECGFLFRKEAAVNDSSLVSCS